MAGADEPDLLYANLAVRGTDRRRCAEEQLGPALALEPDLATVVAGLNDVLRRRYDRAATVGTAGGDGDRAARDRRDGARPSRFPTSPGRADRTNRAARGCDAYNDGDARDRRAHRAIVFDLASAPITRDPRAFSVDRLHASALGHERIAAGMCEALGLPGSDGAWADALPDRPRRRPHAAVAAEVVWVRRHFGPWLVRRARGRSSGDGRLAKAPELIPVEMPGAP